MKHPPATMIPLFLLLPLLAGAAERPYTPSPEDWRDIPIYQVVTDRFSDGDPTNNGANRNSRVNPYAADSLHGGDFQGLENKLDYIQGLGSRAIWISPVVLNVDGAYHGYYPKDFARLDPHWGSMEDLRSLVDAAHERGIYVIIDVVFNHTARLLTSDAPGYARFNPEGYPLQWKDDRRYAPPFDDPANFHGMGHIGNFNDRQQYVMGSLQGLNDIRTESPLVRDALVEAYSQWVTDTDCDGFRFDTAAHVALEDWQAMLPRLREHVASLGKTNFLFLAECLRYADSDVGPFTRTGLFNSALYYPLYSTLQDVLVGKQPTRALADRLGHRQAYGEFSNQLVAFLDNHDKPRMMSPEQLAGDTGQLKAALAFLMTGPFVPCLYYGTEQAFDGKSDHSGREDMFDGQFEQNTSLGDNFDMLSPLYRFASKLHRLREKFPPLRRGAFKSRWHEPRGPGLFVFSRLLGEQEIIVAINTSREERAAVFQGSGPITDLPAGTRLIDALDPETGCIVEKVGPNNRVRFSVPPNYARIFVAASVNIDDPLLVTACSPQHDRFHVPRRQPISLEFNRPMDPLSVEQALTTSPSTAGKLEWSENHRLVIYSPQTRFAEAETITVRLSTGARAKDGTSLHHPFEFQFHTGARPNLAKPLGTFVLDGQLDAEIPQVDSGQGFTLYVRYDRDYGALYVATEAAKKGVDRFILLSDRVEDGLATPPWGKAGTVASQGPVLSDEGDRDYNGWRGINGAADSASGKAYLEGVVNLQEMYDEVPSAVYIAVAEYESQDGGMLVLPDSENLDALHYIRFDL